MSTCKWQFSSVAISSAFAELRPARASVDLSRGTTAPARGDRSAARLSALLSSSGWNFSAINFCSGGRHGAELDGARPLQAFQAARLG